MLPKLRLPMRQTSANFCHVSRACDGLLRIVSYCASWINTTTPLPSLPALHFFHLLSVSQSGAVTVMSTVPAKGNAQLNRRYLIFEVGVYTLTRRGLAGSPPFRNGPTARFSLSWCVSVCPRGRPPRLLLSPVLAVWWFWLGFLRRLDPRLVGKTPPHRAMAGQWPLSSVSSLGRVHHTYDDFLSRRKHPAVQDVGRVDSPKTPLGTSCAKQ